MKLLRTDDEKVEFSVSPAEKRAFAEILGLYPLVPAAHQPLSKSLRDQKMKDNERMLEESLAEQRAENKRLLQNWLEHKAPFRRLKSGYTLTFRREDTEWLLQVLNDIRVGNWLLLGAPAEQVEPDEVDPKLHHVWVAMEISGLFQMALLHGLNGESLE